MDNAGWLDSELFWQARNGLQEIAEQIIYGRVVKKTINKLQGCILSWFVNFEASNIRYISKA
jgi:hypothetical protein